MTCSTFFGSFAHLRATALAHSTSAARRPSGWLGLLIVLQACAAAPAEPAAQGGKVANPVPERVAEAAIPVGVMLFGPCGANAAAAK